MACTASVQPADGETPQSAESPGHDMPVIGAKRILGQWRGGVLTGIQFRAEKLSFSQCQPALGGRYGGKGIGQQGIIAGIGQIDCCNQALRLLIGRDTKQGPQCMVFRG